jgi:hypothetical protein
MDIYCGGAGQAVTGRMRDIAVKLYSFLFKQQQEGDSFFYGNTSHIILFDNEMLVSGDEF